MAQVTVTNISANPVCINDFYRTLAPSESVTVTRSPADLTALYSLQQAMAANTVSVSITYSSDEVASGLISPPSATQAIDMMPVVATAADAPLITIRKAFVAGTPGTADDVAIFAANALPYKFRVLDAVAYVATAIGGSTLMVYSQAAAAGTKLAEMDSATTGPHAQQTMTATAVAAPATLEGLFIRRSDRGVAGEVILTVRRES